MILRAPFPWFGGKRRVAHMVWERFGDVPNYVEPFAGSLAVLLGRPHEARCETVNDADCYLSNFWRSIRASPDLVAQHADWPVNEADLHARHLWLVNQVDFREHMKTDPDFYDAKVAGWWAWGISQWIGGGWCSAAEGSISKRPRLGRGGQESRVARVERRKPSIKNAGVFCLPPPIPDRTRPQMISNGVHAKMPRMDRGGCGVDRRTKRQMPDLHGDSGAYGRGVTASGLDARGGLTQWFEMLADRLRRVRVCCGDWSRIMGPSPTVHIGTTAVFLDPPYSTEAGRDMGIYATDCGDVAHRVREWAIEHQDDPKLRIALCGYEGEHAMPPSWECVAWKAQGGYGAARQGRGRANAERERIWFSPHCLLPSSPTSIQSSFLDAGTVE